MNEGPTAPVAYLLTWNPGKWAWEDLAHDAKLAEQDGKVAGDWSCGGTRRIQPGDRFFLLKQGSNLPRGLMGSGHVTSDVYMSEHWSGEGRQAHYVDLEFDALLDPQRHELLDRRRLDEPPLDKVHWNTQSSGIRIPSEVLPLMEARWRAHLQAIGYGKATSGKPDRTSAAGARAVLERLLPDAVVRQAVLGAFADAMEHVHQTAPRLWSVTLHRDRCRLVVGRGLGCTIHAGSLWMQLAQDGLTARDKATLDRSPEWQWSQSDEGLKTDQLVHGYYRASDPESAIWPIVFRQNNRAMDWLLERSTVVHGASAPAYSPGVIAYISEELRRPLPTPAWVTGRAAVV